MDRMQILEQGDLEWPRLKLEITKAPGAIISINEALVEILIQAL